MVLMSQEVKIKGVLNASYHLYCFHRLNTMTGYDFSTSRLVLKSWTVIPVGLGMGASLQAQLESNGARNHGLESHVLEGAPWVEEDVCSVHRWVVSRGLRPWLSIYTIGTRNPSHLWFHHIEVYQYTILIIQQKQNMDIAAMGFYRCWQDERIDTQYETEEHPDDYFRVVLRFHYQCQNPDDVGALHSYQQSFFWRRDVVLSGDEDYRRFFFLLLEVSGLPRSARESVVNNPIIVAHSMVKDHKNLYRKILPLAVEVLFTSTEPRVMLAARNSMMDRAIALIEAMAMRDDDDVIARATRESMEVVIKFVPATKSSIEALEKATIVDNNSCLEVDRQCRICLETLSIGDEVSRMLCSHIFHGNCIVRWLESSNLCPLCRFAMPC